MTASFLFFAENRLQAGRPLSEISRKLPFRLAVHYAVQLANAGFFFKLRGKMPGSLELKNIRVTGDGFLFLEPGVPIEDDFDETFFLQQIYRLFVQIFLRKDSLPEGKTLGQLIVNYPRGFTDALESLTKTEMTLVHFKWKIMNFHKENTMDFRLLFYRFRFRIPESAPLVLLPLCNVLLPAVKDSPGRWPGQTSEKPLPFSSYNEFADSFYFLDLPKHGLDHLPAPDSLKAKIRAALKQSKGLIEEELSTVVHGDALDSYSLELFSWLAEQIPVRFLILTRQPFSARWNPLLESGKAEIWNPRISNSELEIRSGVLPRFDTAAFLEHAKLKASDSLALALQWMEKEKEQRDTISLEFLKLAPEEEKALLSGNPHPLLSLKGLSSLPGIPFSSGVAMLEQLSEKIVRELEKDEVRGVPRILAELQKESSFFFLMPVADAPEHKFSTEFFALAAYATGQFNRAISYLEPLKARPAFAPLFADALFQTGAMDDMVAFCRDREIRPSCYHFLMAQRGEEFRMEELNPEHRFQILLMQGKLDELQGLLFQYAENTGKDPLFYEFQGEVSFHNDPSEGESLFQQGIQLAQEERRLFRKALLLKRLGNALFRIPRFRDAEACYYQAMELFASLGNPWQFEKVAYNMAMVDLNLCRLDAAADVFQKDLKQNRANRHSRYVVFNLKALGKVAAIAYRFEEAAALLEEALELAKAGGFEAEITGIHYMLVNVYLELEKPELAEQSLKTLAERVKNQPFWDSQLQLLNVEYQRKIGNTNKAALVLSKIDPSGLSPDDVRYVRVLDALITPRSLAEVADLYEDVGKAVSEQFIFSLRAWLLDAYPRLVSVVDEEELKENYHRVRAFNSVLASGFRRHFLARKRSFLDPEIFSRLSRVLDHARKNEQSSFQQAFRRLGEWAGFTDFELRSPRTPAKENIFSIGDSEGRLFLDVLPEPEEEMMPFLQFIINFAASNLPRMASSIRGEDENPGCPYLSLIVGHSEAIHRLKSEISRAADFMFPVLVTGESGTGKELTARAIHYCSKRKDKPFLAINCAALPDNLMESELFGYARGAFTGAQVSRAGLLESARDGTVFLDEIGEMPLVTQAKLLRVLQEREFYRLGDSTPRKVAARFVFATNRNLEEAVREKRFREDLYYRIAGFRLSTPSLRDRQEDIPELASSLLARMDDGAEKKLSSKAKEALSRYSYRGNVRELQNILMMGIVNAGSEREIRPEHLPILSKPAAVPCTGKLKQATKAFQKQYLRQVLEETGYNNSKTGRILGITRQRVIQLRKEYEL